MPSSTTTLLEQLATAEKIADTSVTVEDTEKHIHGMLDRTSVQAMSHGDVVLPGIPIFSTHAEKRQWQLEHMAAAFRHWAREDYIEGMSGHISVRDPENENAFWMNPLGVHFGLLKASDMIMVDLAGNVIGGARHRPLNAAGFLIHAAVHKARPDVHAICHCHSLSGKAWSVFGKRLEMITQDACKFYGAAQSVYDSYGGAVFASEEGDLIAKALGSGKGCILRNHGLLTVGTTVDEAAFLFTSMERSCHVQLAAEAAAASGIKKILIADEEAEYNYKMESDPEACYCEFQPYFSYEEYMSKGDIRN
ncbi:class II aldolase and Adducin domain-containing protein [Leptodontidium sp. MPI-SDFR-AT-0119]|nr:class II aldolase and Adducin domain-containing protein [Leptodontidium sp. MPI-SDFR-AT-0119]